MGFAVGKVDCGRSVAGSGNFGRAPCVWKQFLSVASGVRHMNRSVFALAVILLFAASPAAGADPRRGDVAALERKLVGRWVGQGGCDGQLVIQADGVYELTGYSPGAVSSAGKWTVEWNELPPTLVLTCTKSEASEDVGTDLNVALLELNDSSLKVGHADPNGAPSGEYLRAIDADSIKDKVSVALGEEFAIDFNRDGNRLLQPSKSKGTDNKTARIKLGVTTASPVPPPREGATRPFLQVENNFEETLQFRVLVRLKGSKETFEIVDDVKPLPSGDIFNQCWDFDSRVEEVVLYGFTLSDERDE